MSPQHQTLLRCNLDKFVNNMNPDGVLNTLLALRAITPRNYEDIKSKSTRHERVELLFAILPTRADSAFGHLITALDKSEQPHVANLIRV